MSEVKGSDCLTLYIKVYELSRIYEAECFYELVLQQITFYLSKLGLFGFISPKTVNYLAFQSFDFEDT